ncbi:AraC family transcriptional regulator [Aquimarina sp. 2201CG14-23]|uniref:AraC family transcriptional regulator n=1 Tax=Aquimarina mycalae TaxID=3040073 RepID=UPI0024780596|nr:AraC family transcriptional regulator [Aquimarina sp. 2201CG14-23]MDH7445032.1 AraC family transcriptional regulator [Aquimarina sp. 2201CG14-23]
MKLSYEQIYLEQSKSLKIESYTKDSLCHEINWHLHPEYEIVFIRNGSGTLQAASTIKNYDDGLLIFIGPNIPHMPFGNKQFGNNVEVVIQFSESFILEKLGYFPEFYSILEFIRKLPKGYIFSKETKQELTDSFLKLANQNNTEKLLTFIHILYHLSIASHKNPITKSNHNLEINKNSLERISKVFEYINKNYAKRIQSETIAKELGLTPNSFCRMFKSSTNKSFIHFLNEFRIKKAQELFENKNTSISDVLYKCGFNDHSYFCRQFRKYTAMSPSQYIKKLE